MGPPPRKLKCKSAAKPRGFGQESATRFGLAEVGSTKRCRFKARVHRETEQARPKPAPPLKWVGPAPPCETVAVSNQRRQPGGGPCRSIAFTNCRCLRS